ncbi:hypothetical protein KRMM14A1259_68090 [Krasilnikovia sp. MM14-A1259]
MWTEGDWGWACGYPNCLARADGSPRTPCLCGRHTVRTRQPAGNERIAPTLAAHEIATLVADTPRSALGDNHLRLLFDGDFLRV